MDEALVTQPTTKLSFSEQIHCVELSPYEWSQHLICIALGEELIVGTVNFQVIYQWLYVCKFRSLSLFLKISTHAVSIWNFTQNFISKINFLFQEEDELVEDISYKPLRTFHHDTRVHAIAWSPETSLSVVPKIVSFCAAGADFRIRLYNSNLNDVHVYEVNIFRNGIFYKLEHINNKI